MGGLTGMYNVSPSKTHKLFIRLCSPFPSSTNSTKNNTPNTTTHSPDAVNEDFSGTLPFERIRYFRKLNNGKLNFTDNNDFNVKTIIKLSTGV